MVSEEAAVPSEEAMAESPHVSNPAQSQNQGFQVSDLMDSVASMESPDKSPHEVEPSQSPEVPDILSSVPSIAQS